MKYLKKFENFRDYAKRLIETPLFFDHDEKLKYIDENGKVRYCRYIRDEVLRGEMGAYNFFTGKAVSIVNDEKEGRKHILKSKLQRLSDTEKESDKYNL